MAGDATADAPPGSVPGEEEAASGASRKRGRGAPKGKSGGRASKAGKARKQDVATSGVGGVVVAGGGAGGGAGAGAGAGVGGGAVPSAAGVVAQLRAARGLPVAVPRLEEVADRF